MKHLYYVRHGESYINISDIFSSKVGTPNDKGLTETGQKQAENGAKYAKEAGLKPDILFCSPLKRAQETAILLAKELGYPEKDIVTSGLFVEMQYGELEGTPWMAFWESGKSYKNLGDYAGAETLEAMQQRAKKALEYLQSRPEETILVVSHAAFGRALKREIDGKPFSDEFENHTELPHGEVNKLL
ncbi:MAG: histidine phosphatase family protein [Candidatus Saccharimonadales bacterium]